VKQSQRRSARAANFLPLQLQLPAPSRIGESPANQAHRVRQ
jgi:hypothetical protein